MTAHDVTERPAAFDAVPPDSPAVVTLEDLGRELKSLLRRSPQRRVKVGALAKRVGVSQSTLYAYLAGSTLPSTEVLDDLLHALEVPPAVHRRLATARDALERHRRRPRERHEPPAKPIPRELPADPTDFVGRTGELTQLGGTLRAAGDGGPLAAVVSGPAGVGKTALAVRWGHRVAEEFPDGCLYVDLLGFSPGEPRPPAAVLAAFLRSLGAAETEIPDDPLERENRLRSRLAGLRVLVVLDNAVDVDQVRPLLPGEPGCFVVVTSRRELGGLQVRPGARPVPVPPLPTDLGVDLLRSRMPDQALSGARESVRTLAERCGGLPLALRVAAAHAATRPHHALHELADGLDLFDVGDEATSVRSVFSWSERRLSPGAATAFHLLGLAPLHELDARAAAALLDTGIRVARRRIDELVRAHLLQQSPLGRVRMHDLIREHARERAAERLSDAYGARATDRLICHLSETAARAMDLLHPWDAEPAPSGELLHGPMLRSRSQAQAWVDTEWENLLAALTFSAEQERPDQTLRLASALRRHLDQSGHHLEALTVHGAARDAARRTGDRVAEGTAIRDLGAAYLRLGRHREAMEHYHDALALTRETGDRGGEAGTLNNLGNVHERLGSYQEALDHYHRALPIARDLGIEGGEATLLVNVGVARARRCEYDQALEDCHRALTMFERLGDSGGAARCLGNLGDIHRSAGHHATSLSLLDDGLTRARAVGATSIETEILNSLGETRLASGLRDAARSCHEIALDGARASGDPYEEARALEGLGRALAESGELAEARAAWRDSTVVYEALGLPEADRVRRVALTS